MGLGFQDAFYTEVDCVSSVQHCPQLLTNVRVHVIQTLGLLQMRPQRMTAPGGDQGDLARAVFRSCFS